VQQISLYYSTLTSFFEFFIDVFVIYKVKVIVTTAREVAVDGVIP